MSLCGKVDAILIHRLDEIVPGYAGSFPLVINSLIPDLDLIRILFTQLICRLLF
ncbi:hypothetical protein ES703_123121 [subsurface metagenome]